MCALLTWYIYFTRYITLSPSFTTILFGKLFKLVTPEHLGHDSDSYVRFPYAKVWHLGVTWKLIHNTVKCFDQLNVSAYLKKHVQRIWEKAAFVSYFCILFLLLFPLIDWGKLAHNWLCKCCNIVWLWSIYTGYIYWISPELLTYIYGTTSSIYHFFHLF